MERDSIQIAFENWFSIDERLHFDRKTRKYYMHNGVADMRTNIRFEAFEAGRKPFQNDLIGVKHLQHNFHFKAIRESDIPQNQIDALTQIRDILRENELVMIHGKRHIEIREPSDGVRQGKLVATSFII